MLAQQSDWVLITDVQLHAPMRSFGWCLQLKIVLMHKELSMCVV